MLLFSYIEGLLKEAPKQYFYDELKVMSEALYHTVAPGNVIQTSKGKSMLISQLEENEPVDYLLIKEYFYL